MCNTFYIVFICSLIPIIILDSFIYLYNYDVWGQFRLGLCCVLAYLQWYVHYRVFFKPFSWRPKYQHQNLTRPKTEKMLTYQSYWEGWACQAFTELHKVWGYFGHAQPHRSALLWLLRQHVLWILKRVLINYWIIIHLIRLWLKIWFCCIVVYNDKSGFFPLFIFFGFFLGGSRKGPRPKLKTLATQVWVATHSLKTSGLLVWLDTADGYLTIYDPLRYW